MLSYTPNQSQEVTIINKLEIQMTCKLCKSKHLTELKKIRIREGVFGNITKEEFSIIQCEDCGIQYLEPFPSSDEDYYSNDQYRSSYSPKELDPQEYFSTAANLQLDYIAKTGLLIFKDKVVADIGCGAGVFLDLIKGVAKKTIAIEPTASYHKSLEDRNHLVYDSLNNLDDNSIDIIVNLDVIEHVDDPLKFFKDIRSKLNEYGDFFCLTPNINDILMKLDIEDFDQFYYRTVHLWYHSAKSFNWLARESGFSFTEVSFLHKYDLSNVIGWLKERRPVGLSYATLFDERLDLAWKAFLEEKGFADSLFLHAKK